MKHSIIEFRKAKPVRIAVWTPWGAVPTARARGKVQPTSEKTTKTVIDAGSPPGGARGVKRHLSS